MSTEVPRLTSLSHGAGCACKLSLDELRGVLAGLVRASSPDVLVDHLTGDDAAVWTDPSGTMNVATTDFFTPVVDDPRTWGRIAAANAVSDVYAMGGIPRVALNILGWPRALPSEQLAEVLAGAQDIASLAGYDIVGGHSIDAAEPFYGQVVIGRIEPGQLLTNAGGRTGDALILTKPIGTGIVMTALKRSERPAADVPGYREAVESMTRLNDVASAAAVSASASAATDVTGFGLLGHLHRLAAASGVGAVLDAGAVPVLPHVLDLIDEGLVPGGTQRNADQAARYLVKGGDERDTALLADAQTSGGLLIAVAEGRAAELVAELVRTGHEAARVGRLEAAPAGSIRVEGRVPRGTVRR